MPLADYFSAIRRQTDALRTGTSSATSGGTLFPTTTQPSNTTVNTGMFEQSDPYQETPVVPRVPITETQQAAQETFTPSAPQQQAVGNVYAQEAAQPPPRPPATGALANAARRFSGSVATNPFITQPGRTDLTSGYLPNLSMINPAFWRYTSPVIQQALSGLYRSGGLRLEDLDFIKNMWRPMGL